MIVTAARSTTQFVSCSAIRTPQYLTSGSPFTPFYNVDSGDGGRKTSETNNFRTPSLSATVYKPNLGATNSLQTVYGVLSVRSVGRRACDMLLADSTREVCNPSTATRLYGGHTETTACDRRTEHLPWVFLTGQQPGVLAGGGRAHSRLQCAG